ncbi:MAG TPA: hypothetical protein VHL52_04845 [Acidimicrobiia bacterium]|nr:hypothetical protein [Acidimicrobiia bacterium]
MLEVRINATVHAHAVTRARWCERLGTALFQEKQGFPWEDDGSLIDLPRGLTFRSIDQAGIETFRSVMAACGAGTLDRNDRYYWEGCGPDNLAARMMAYLTEEDAPMGLLGYRVDDPVGYVAVVRDDDLVSTIAHIGDIHDLLSAGIPAARRRGWSRCSRMSTW